LTPPWNTSINIYTSDDDTSDIDDIEILFNESDSGDINDEVYLSNDKGPNLLNTTSLKQQASM
jgi:hypothetical protein